MRYFDEQLVANSRPHRMWWNEVSAQRETFHISEDSLARIAHQTGLSANAAAVLPRDAWLEFDDITKRVMRLDDGEAYMADLMPLARSVHIGKIQFMNRVSSDAGTVRRSISGQVPEVVGKTDYDYRSTIVPIFNTGYGRSWREWNSLSSENFDALMDDQENHLVALRKDQASYVLDGDASLAFNGETGYGIRTSPYSWSINIGAAGANIDLTDPATTADEMDAFFTTTFGNALDDNYITQPVNIYVSLDIARNLDRSYSGAAGYKPGRILDYLLTNRRINKIVATNMLEGNEFFGFVPSSQFIRPIIGMATNTTAMVRTNPVDDYNFLVMGALGIEIRADWNGRGGVFYSAEV